MELPIVSGDPLGVLSSTRPVVLAARHVKIDLEVIRSTAATLPDLALPSPNWGEDLHFRDGTWRTAAWVFVLDALNFCFWSTDPQRRWRVSYDGDTYDGYWALVAALRRAGDEGYELWDSRFLRDLDLGTVSRLLRPDSPDDPAIPLLEERQKNLNELGRQLLAFQLAAANSPEATPVESLVQAAQGSAAQLVTLVRTWLPSFDDVARWQGNQVRFLKRAQILVADLHAAFSGEGLGHFDDLTALTAFADYKVPQVLRRLGILHYDEELTSIIDRRLLIPPGSRYEIEIRAATIWAVELVRQALSTAGRELAAYEIDWALWQAGQTHDAADRPYHRTLTVFY